MKANEFITEKWSQKYKSSINCSNPKGFSQKAHCAGKNKQDESVNEDFSNNVSTENMIAYLRKHHDTNLHQDYLDHINTFGKFVLKNIPVNTIKTELAGLDQAKVEQYKKMDFSKAPPIVMGDGYILDGYHRATVAKALGIPTIRGYVGVKGLVKELSEEFDLIESIIESLADRNGVDSEVIWEDLESLDDDELYVFATTTPVMEDTVQIPHKGKMVSGKVVRKDPVSGEYIVDVGEYGSVRVPAHKVKHDVEEDWQKANKKDRTAGMSQKAVNAYRRENPGSKLKTAVTTKPSKLKKGSKASKRRKSYCSRSRGQMKMHNISCAKTPDKAICKARRRWNC